MFKQLPLEIGMHTISMIPVLEMAKADKNIDYPKLDRLIRDRITYLKNMGEYKITHLVYKHRIDDNEIVYDFTIGGGEFIVAIVITENNKPFWKWELPQQYYGLDHVDHYDPFIEDFENPAYPSYSVVGYSNTYLEEDNHYKGMNPEDYKVLIDHDQLPQHIKHIGFVFPIEMRWLDHLVEPIIPPDEDDYGGSIDASDEFREDAGEYEQTIEGYLPYAIIFHTYLFHLTKYAGYWNLNTFHMIDFQENGIIYQPERYQFQGFTADVVNLYWKIHHHFTAYRSFGLE